MSAPKRVVYDFSGPSPTAAVIDGSEELLSVETRAEAESDDAAFDRLFAGPLDQGDIEAD